jgi:hypothetical protein
MSAYGFGMRSVALTIALPLTAYMRTPQTTK